MPVGPGFTDALDVSPGDAILASHVDSLADNTETNREMGDVSHDFDITTGTGYHRATYSSPMILANAAGTRYAQLWLGTDGANVQLWIKTGASLVASTPASDTDGVAIAVGS